MNLNSLDNYKPINNFILVKPDADNDTLTLSKGFVLHLSTVHEPYKHATTTGTVVKVPERIDYYDVQSNASVEYKTEMELQAGDKVIFHFLTASTNIKENKYIDCDGERFFQVKYDRIFCAIRNDEIIIPNGYLIVEAVEEELPKTTLFLPQSMKKEESNNTGIIKYAGTPLKGYRDYPGEVDEDEVQVGDKVLFRSVERVYLQNPMHNTIEKNKIYYRMHRRDILGVFANEEA